VAVSELGRQLVVLGASAGGMDALTQVLAAMPANLQAPILIAQHLDPDRPSHLAALLDGKTTLSVHAVEGATSLEDGHAYVLSPTGSVAVRIGRLEVADESQSRPSPSIDRLLASAAEAYGEGVTAVILSGTGSDGAAGARQVAAAGGTVVVQNPETAAHRGMPDAISASIIDILADADAIGPLLVELVAAPRTAKRDDDRALRSFLASLRERSGIDFSAYKRGTILRRLQRRMLATDSEDLRAYRRYAEENEDELNRLTSSFLIKVTEFFRDPDLFERLRDYVLPQLIGESEKQGRELRVWSAGCATGEEAYSIAILIAELLGDRLPQFNVRIFATDLDADAVAFARRGRYAAGVVDSVPEDLRARYFTQVGDMFEVSKRIRSMTVFGQHDLGQRAPFPRVDLALCRNVLIYFTAELQRRALQLFAYALRDGGYLALGKSESTSPLAQHFVLADARLKLYRREGERVLIPASRDRDGPKSPVLKMPVARRPGWTAAGARAEGGSKPVSLAERAEQLLLRLPVGVVVVDRQYDVQLINLAARDLLGIHVQAVAEDLIHLLDGPLGATVKKAIDAALRGKPLGPQPVQLESITAERTDIRHVEITAEPFKGPDARSPLDWVLVVATDVSRSIGEARELSDTAARDTSERERAIAQARSLADANEELRSVNRDLTTANAELRTANEELLVASEEVQAATEEVETLNEELQATNEELETMNEELQATVEELNATNDDLEARSNELQELATSADDARATVEDDRTRLLAILDGIDEPVLIVDHDGEVIKANAPFQRVVGMDAAAKVPAEIRRRATTATFEEVVELGGRRFRVSGQSLDGHSGPGGALIFRRA
jgi:two-component system, chemotaxis family, CheB/CheR fusion protein